MAEVGGINILGVRLLQFSGYLFPERMVQDNVALGDSSWSSSSGGSGSKGGYVSIRENKKNEQ